MGETVLFFSLPQLSEEVAGDVQLSIWTDEIGQNFAANYSFQCLDARRAERMYLQPAKAYAGEPTFITVGIINFHDQDAVYPIR